MKNKKFLGTVLSLVSLFLLASLTFGLSVFATEPAKFLDDSSVKTSKSSSSSSSSSSKNNDESSSKNGTTNSGGSVNISGYRVYRYDGTVPEKITPGMEFQLEVSVFDERPSADVKKLTPKTRLNSESFVKYNGVEPILVSPPKARNNGWDYTFNFSLVYTGGSNVFQFDLYYENLSTKSLPYETVSVQLNNCMEEKEISASDASNSTRGTGFVLKSASYGGPKVIAGDEFVFSAEIMATSGSHAVDNVSVGITPPTEISIVDGTSVRYVGTVSPNQTITVEYKLKASAAIAEAGSYKITLDISGVGEKEGEEIKASMDITAPVMPLERFEISKVFSPEIISAATEGVEDMNMVTVNFVNMGKGIIYNVRGEIKGKGLSTQEGRLFIGNVTAGTDGSADFNLSASEMGKIDAILELTYENDMGEEKLLEHKFSVEVQEGMAVEDPFPMIEPEIEEEEKGVPIWVWVIIGVVIIAGAIVGIIVLRKKKKAKAEQEELEDFDDEDF